MTSRTLRASRLRQVSRNMSARRPLAAAASWSARHRREDLVAVGRRAARRRSGRRRGTRPGRSTTPPPGRGSPSRRSGRTRRRCAAGSRSTSAPSWCCRGCRWARRRRRSTGWLTSARAHATRCCWPPDISLGRWPSRSRRPTASTTGSNHAGSGLRPARPSGSRMFSSAVRVGIRLNAWKTKPICSRRSAVSCLVLEAGQRGAVDDGLAGGRGVERGEAVHQGRLARARRAHDRGELAGVAGRR